MRVCIGRAEWRTNSLTDSLIDSLTNCLTGCLHEAVNEFDHGAEDVQHDFP